MSAKTEGPLRLIRFNIDHYMRVTALQVDAQGKSVVISGKNTSGKTSCLNAIWEALGGKSPGGAAEPVQKGARSAKVALDLGEYLVERHWTEKGSRLVVTAADGSKVARPQQLLDGLLSRACLDPGLFLARRPAEQVEDLLAVAGVAPPVERVARITGEQIPAGEEESADHYLERLAGESGPYYLRRRDANREADRKDSALAEARKALDRLGGPLPEGEGPPSASDLLARIAELEKGQEARRLRQRVADEAAQELKAKEAKLADLRHRHAEALDRANRLEHEIAELQQRLKAYRDDAATLEGRLKKGGQVVADLRTAAEVEGNRLAQLPDHAGEIGGLRQQVAQAEREAAGVAERRRAAGDVERLEGELAAARKEGEGLDRILAGLRELRAHLLDGADLGVPGLAVGDGELRLNGVPLRQASMAERLRVALAVAMRQRPRLRLLRLDEAERLDSDSKALVLKLAGEAQFQVLMAAVSDAEQLQVEILEG
jgi:hypothetical protein